MRMTILAGLITGAALAMQATLNAHAKPKPIPANRAIRIRVIAPWYTADATGVLADYGIPTKEAADISPKTGPITSS